MKRKKITKRDVLFFFLGVIAILLLELVLNWNENIQAFEEGFMKGYQEGIK